MALFTCRAAMMASRGLRSVLVVPDAMSSAWFHANVFGGAAELVFLKGRVPFVLDGKEVSGNNVGTVLAYYTRRGLAARMPVVDTASTQRIKRGELFVRPAARQLGILDQ